MESSFSMASRANLTKHRPHASRDDIASGFADAWLTAGNAGIKLSRNFQIKEKFADISGLFDVIPSLKKLVARVVTHNLDILHGIRIKKRSRLLP